MTHNKELHNLYSSPNITKMLKSRRFSMYWKEEKHSTASIGKAEGNRPLETPTQ
jgi:hypothetical protein